MLTWEVIIKIGHIIGTVLGVGGTTIAGFLHFKKLAGTVIDKASDTEFSRAIYFIVRVGIVILVLSGFGFLLLARIEGETGHILGPRVLAKLTITLIILVNAVLLQVRKIPFWLGSAISFTSWYAALIIGAWRIRAGFWDLMLYFLIAIAIVAIVQEIITRIIQKKT